MEVLASNDKYRLVIGYGPHMNRRYEIEKKGYYYMDMGNEIKKVVTWELEVHGSDYNRIMEAWKKRC